MKKTLAALLIVALLALRIAGALAFSLTLPENPSTGYTWTYAGSNEKVLVPEGSSYKPDAYQTQRVGAGGGRTWVFQKGEDGDAVLRFTCSRADGTIAAQYNTYLYRVEQGLLHWRADIRVDRSQVEIGLPENPSTGYTWRVDSDNDGILKLEKSTYNDYITNDNLLGQGGAHRWKYVPEAPGEVAITFTHARSGDIKGEETLVFVFNVDEGLGVTSVYP